MSSERYLISYEGDLARSVIESKVSWYSDQVVADRPLADDAHPAVAGIREQLFDRGVVVADVESLAAALSWLGDRWQLHADADDPAGFPYPDPEDDRILVWRASAGKEFAVVWHCSGWHFEFDAYDLPGGPLAQGALPGRLITLQRAALGDY